MFKSAIVNYRHFLVVPVKTTETIAGNPEFTSLD